MIEVPLAEGLGRTKGVVVNLPTGEKSKMYLERLRDIERQAKDQKGALGRIPRNRTLSDTQMTPNPALQQTRRKRRVAELARWQ